MKRTLNMIVVGQQETCAMEGSTLKGSGIRLSFWEKGNVQKRSGRVERNHLSYRGDRKHYLKKGEGVLTKRTLPRKKRKKKGTTV